MRHKLGNENLLYNLAQTYMCHESMVISFGHLCYALRMELVWGRAQWPMNAKFHGIVEWGTNIVSHHVPTWYYFI